jgi:hypothetical protein
VNGLAQSIAKNNIVPTLLPGTKLPSGGILKSPDPLVAQLGINSPPQPTNQPTIDNVRFGIWNNKANGCTQHDVMFGVGLTDAFMVNQGLMPNGPAYKIGKTYWTNKQLTIDLVAA